MKLESFEDELTRIRHAMDDAEDGAGYELLRAQWIRLREAERRRQPIAVQALDGLCSAKQIIDAYGGFDAFLKLTTGRAA